MAKVSEFVLLLLATSCLNSMALPVRKMLQDQDDQGFRVDLIHPNSPHSPFHTPNATRLERIRNLVVRSNARVAAMVRKLSGNYAAKDYESPLSPSGGGYVMEFVVGTPGQKFKAIADTGSDLVWVQSDPCASCSGGSGSIFHPNSSSTYKTIDCSTALCQQLPNAHCGSKSKCSYLYQYGSGSTGGTFAYETISLSIVGGGSKQFPKFAVGFGTDNDGFNGVDGLVGLGQGPISLPAQLASTIKNKFSYCMVDILSTGKSSPLFFGDVAALKGSGIQSTPIVRNGIYETYYLLDVQGVSINGKSYGNPGTTIIDSGTTLTYVPSTMYANLLSAFKKAITLKPVDGSSIGLDLCYDISSDKNYKFPSLTIKFDGATLTPPSTNYFLVVDDNATTACLAMGSADGLPVSIIGNVMQQGLHVLYDRGSSTLSYVPANCENL